MHTLRMLTRASTRSAAQETCLLWPYLRSPAEMGCTETQELSHLFIRSKRGKVTLQEAKAKSFGRGALRLKILNLTPRSLPVALPRGSIFLSQTKYEQCLMTQRDIELTLAPEEHRELVLDAYCGVSSLSCPGSLSSGRMQLSPLMVPPEVCVRGQTGIWAWTKRDNPQVPPSVRRSTAGFLPSFENYQVLMHSFPEEHALIRESIGAAGLDPDEARSLMSSHLYGGAWDEELFRSLPRAEQVEMLAVHGQSHFRESRGGDDDDTVIEGGSDGGGSDGGGDGGGGD